MFEGIDGRIAEGDDEINPLCDELFGKSRYSVVPSTSPYELKPDVSFLVPTKRPHIASKRFGEDFIHILGIDAQHAEYRHCRLLRARRERPRRRTTEQHYELAASHHSITSSAANADIPDPAPTCRRSRYRLR